MWRDGFWRSITKLTPEELHIWTSIRSSRKEYCSKWGKKQIEINRKYSGRKFTAL
jgi:hypothetical protein